MAIANRLTHDAPARVRHLVLINSVGHPAGSGGPSVLPQRPERPPWEYGLRFAKEDTPAGEVWDSRLEVYSTDPAVEPDMTKWETTLLFKLA